MVAKPRLFCLEKVVGCLAFVHAVATEAAYVALAVGGALKVCVLALMTSLTPFVNFFG